MRIDNVCGKIQEIIEGILKFLIRTQKKSFVLVHRCFGSKRMCVICIMSICVRMCVCSAECVHVNTFQSFQSTYLS